MEKNYSYKTAPGRRLERIVEKSEECHAELLLLFESAHQQELHLSSDSWTVIL